MTTNTNRATTTNNTEPVATTTEEQIVQQQLAQATSMQREQLAQNVQRLLWALIVQRQRLTLSPQLQPQALVGRKTHRSKGMCIHTATTEEEHAISINEKDH